ncbi:hypothetical protein AVEN_212059-1 [Araneus ventricosus]|uniref:Uncharacterized protein n=1 Tax=Araneus ventricosus TaxID=182803 RepID=A0A4Y2D475_ARAVE|nr:hypothetical protein AVEN_212059-1 [Araneus ventricosus]
MAWKVLWPSNVCVLKSALSETNCENALSSICNGKRIIAETLNSIASVYEEQNPRYDNVSINSEIHTFETKMQLLRPVMMIRKISALSRQLYTLNSIERFLDSKRERT